MSDVLKGLYARRDELARRITEALNSEKPIAANDPGESVIDLQLQLNSVGSQINAYLGSQERWDRSA